MKYILILIYISCSFLVFAQDTTEKVLRVGGGVMSELPNMIFSDADSLIDFDFNYSKKDMNVEISLWETSLGTDTLRKVVLLNENIIKNESEQITLRVDQNKSQIDIICSVPGKMIIITPLKPQKKQIEAYKFLSKPQIIDINVPIMLFVDGDDKIEEKNLHEILSTQNIKSIDYREVRKIKENVGNFKILTYHLKYIQ